MMRKASLNEKASRDEKNFTCDGKSFKIDNKTRRLLNLKNDNGIAFFKMQMKWYEY